MKISYRISERDYVQASLLAARPPHRSLWIGAIAVIVLIVVAAIGPSLIAAASIGALAAGALWWAVRRYLVPRKARRYYRKYDAARTNFTLRLSNDGLEFGLRKGMSKLSWSDIVRWRHDAHCVLVYATPKLYHAIPKSNEDDRAFIATLIERLRLNVGAPLR